MSTTYPRSTSSDHPGSDSDVHARTWLKPNQVDELRGTCLSEAVPTYRQDRNEAIVALAYDTGIRVGALDLLDVDQLDFQSGSLYLLSEIQKGNPPPATLDLEASTARLLRRYLRDRWKDTPALFPSRSSDRLSERSVRPVIEKLARLD